VYFSELHGECTYPPNDFFVMFMYMTEAVNSTDNIMLHRNIKYISFYSVKY